MSEILIASILVGALCAALAALLVLAERYLGDYGACTIDINRGRREFQVQGGQTLLASLLANEIFIPSACGGKGTCAYCKVKVLEGGGQLIPTELPYLDEKEKKAGVRLSCQVKVRSDIDIEIPETLFSIRNYRGKVERIRDFTHDMKELRIALVEPKTIDFVAGQYVQLEAPPYPGSPEAVYRAYSMSSPPSDKQHIELIIRLVPQGICTTWVFKRLRVGDEVVFNGPYGEFGLTGTDAPMVWVAGGSGMAPFWSIVREMAETNVTRKTVYFFGALSKRDLFLLDEFKEMEKKLPDFRFVPALSEPAEGDRWTGEKGLITDVAQRTLPEDCSGMEAYYCGSAGMIDAAKTVLVNKGIPEEKMHYDSFT